MSLDEGKGQGNQNYVQSNEGGLLLLLIKQIEAAKVSIGWFTAAEKPIDIGFHGNGKSAIAGRGNE